MKRPTSRLARLTALAAPLALCVSLAACGSDDEEPSTDSTAESASDPTSAPDSAESTDAPSDSTADPTDDTSSGASTTVTEIAYFAPLATNTFVQATDEGMHAEAANHGYNITMFDAQFDATTQVNQIQDAIATGKFQAFVITPINGPGLVQVAQEAIDEGIFVVTTLNSIGPDLDSLESSVDGVVSIGQTFTANGNNIGNLIVEACADNDPCKVAYMPADSAQATEKIRTEGVMQILEATPSIEIVSTQASGFDAGSGLATAQDIITAHPDIDVLGGGAGQAVIGAMQALSQANLADVKVVSNGATTDEVDAIRAGTIYGAPVFLPRTEGVVAIQIIAQQAAGEDVPSAIDEIEYSTIGNIATAETLSTEAGLEFTGEYEAN